MKLAQNHLAASRIVISEKCDETVRYAADELARHLFAMSGASFPVATDALELQENDILLGINRHTDALGFSKRIDALPKEGFFYCTAPRALIIGGKGRGLLYGVYSFL